MLLKQLNSTFSFLWSATCFIMIFISTLYPWTVKIKMWPGITKWCEVYKQCFWNVKFKIWNISETWRLKCEMYQKCAIEENMKCFRNMMFKTLQYKYFRNLTFKTWNVSEMWHLQYGRFHKHHNYLEYEMFQKYDVQDLKCFKSDIQNMKCIRNTTFETWNVLEMWCSK